MSEDRAKATIVEMFSDKLGEPLTDRNGDFYIATIADPVQVKGPYASYGDAEGRSRGWFDLIGPAEIHQNLWLSKGEKAHYEEVAEVESEHPIWYDNETGVGVYEIVVWLGAKRIADKKHPRNRFWVYQRGNTVALGVFANPKHAVGFAKEFILDQAKIKAALTAENASGPSGSSASY